MTKTLTKFEQLVDGLCPNIQLDEVDEALQVKNAIFIIQSSSTPLKEKNII